MYVSSNFQGNFSSRTRTKITQILRHSFHPNYLRTHNWPVERHSKTHPSLDSFIRTTGNQRLHMAGIDSETISRLGLMEEYYNRGPSSGTTTLPPVIHLLSSILEKWIQKNETMFSKVKDVITIFHGSKPPSLSIRSYVERIFKYGRCSTSCFVVGYIYMDRFVARTGTCLTSLNAHRILITSIMLAAKFLDDECHNNAYYAKIGGVSIAEMNRMEMKFLFSSDFRLHVTVPDFRNYCWKLEKGDGGENLIDVPPIHSRRQKQGWPKKDDIRDSSTIAGYSFKAM